MAVQADRPDKAGWFRVDRAQLGQEIQRPGISKSRRDQMKASVLTVSILIDLIEGAKVALRF